MTHPFPSLNQCLSAPCKHTQTDLGTIKREMGKVLAVCHVLLPSLPLVTFELNSILQIGLDPPPSEEQEPSKHQT